MNAIHARQLLTCLSLVMSLFVALEAKAEDEHRRKVAMLVWEGVELMEFTGPGTIFAFAKGYEPFTVAPSLEPIKSYFITLVPQYTFEDSPPPDVIVVPAGVFMMKNEALNDWLRKFVPKADAVLSVCNGSLILANAGLLDDQAATAPNANLDDLRILGQDIKPVFDRRFVESGKFVTANSHFAGVDGALHVIRRLSGLEAAQRVADRALYAWPKEEFERMLAKPPAQHRSRRYEVFRKLQREGVESAVEFYRQWPESVPPCPPPLQSADEENLFRYTIWNLQNAKRFDDSLKLCRVSAAVFPPSAMSAACLGEALLKNGDGNEALKHFRTALEMEPAHRYALKVLEQWINEAVDKESPEVRAAGELRNMKQAPRDSGQGS